MRCSVTLAALAALALTPLGSTAGLYSKSSPVLQVDGKNFDKLIKNSDKASVLSLQLSVSMVGLTVYRLWSKFYKTVPPQLVAYYPKILCAMVWPLSKSETCIRESCKKS